VHRVSRVTLEQLDCLVQSGPVGHQDQPVTGVTMGQQELLENRDSREPVVLREIMGKLVSRERKEVQDLPDKLDQLVNQVQPVSQGLKVVQAYQELRVNLEHPELQEPLEAKEPLDSRVKMETWDQQDRLGQLVPMDREDKMEILELQDSLEIRDQEGPLVPRDPLEYRGSLGQLVNLVLRDFLVLLVHRDNLDQRES